MTGTAFFLLYYFVRERERAAALIAAERERSERLLLNVLPAPIAERLKSGESPIADRASEAGVLFADLVGFTPLSGQMPPDEVVRLLDEVFTLFDGLVAKHGAGEDQDDRRCLHGLDHLARWLGSKRKEGLHDHRWGQVLGTGSGGPGVGEGASRKG